MWIGNLMLLIINLPLVGLWVKLLQVPYRLMFPAILIFCCIGVYSLNNSVVDVYLTAACGLLGLFLLKNNFEPAPMLLGFILGPMMEEFLRRALLLTKGDPSVFIRRPISATMLLIAVLAMISVILPALRKKREEAFAEED